MYVSHSDARQAMSVCWFLQWCSLDWINYLINCQEVFIHKFSPEDDFDWFWRPLKIFIRSKFCFVQNLHFVSFSYNWFRAKEMLAIQKAGLRRVNTIKILPLNISMLAMMLWVSWPHSIAAHTALLLLEVKEVTKQELKHHLHDVN